MVKTLRASFDLLIQFYHPFHFPYFRFLPKRAKNPWIRRKKGGKIQPRQLRLTGHWFRVQRNLSLFRGGKPRKFRVKKSDGCSTFARFTVWSVQMQRRNEKKSIIQCDSKLLHELLDVLTVKRNNGDQLNLFWNFIFEIYFVLHFLNIEETL